MALFPLSEDELKQITARLEDLKIEHRDLDEIIQRLNQAPDVDQLQLRRLKKRKLSLKDNIVRLESMLIPDLDA